MYERKAIISNPSGLTLTITTVPWLTTVPRLSTGPMINLPLMMTVPLLIMVPSIPDHHAAPYHRATRDHPTPVLATSDHPAIDCLLQIAGPAGDSVLPMVSSARATQQWLDIWLCSDRLASFFIKQASSVFASAHSPIHLLRTTDNLGLCWLCQH